MDQKWTIVLFLLAQLSLSSVEAISVDDVRVPVVKTEIAGEQYYVAVASAAVVNPSSGRSNLQVSISTNGSTWSEWTDISTSVPMASNPAAVSAYVPVTKCTQALVFFLYENGQVGLLLQSPKDPATFSLYVLGKVIPASKDSKNFSRNPIQAIHHKNVTHIFVRSQTNTSQLFYNTLTVNDTIMVDLGNDTWLPIGSSGDHLKFDAHAAVNLFLDRIEVFGVFEDNYVHHTWQTGKTSFYGKWKKLGLFSPKFNSSPVAHPMGHSDFNGVLSLFVRGVDGLMRRIAQTTCDKQKNPWGPCTWGLFKKLGSVPPSSPLARNPFIASNSIHLGIEVFVIGRKDGELYHIWQRERDASWSDWEKLGGLPSSTFMSQPTMMFDDNGWWQAYGLTSDMSLARFVQSPLSFTLSTDKVSYDHNVTVSWAIPEDEATHKDWIGVYPDGASSHGYVDFSYVGGTQNPLKDPVPEGSVNLTAALPNGVYHYKYMVNKEYDAVLEASLSISDAPSEPEWVQVYTGIARGLGNLNSNVTECVEDGNITVATFRAAFDDFANRKIYDGLHKFAEGLSDVRDALIACEETAIIEDLNKFIKDLISCIEGNCVNFGIDLSVEVVILFEHIYEIYGDIQAATNCFKVDAYKQGGICIGRVTYACLTLE